MIGIILAAGVGSRLRPMTNNKPKCLVKTANKPILQYQLDSYLKAGIRDLVIVVGYESEVIRNYCKHISDFNITIIDNPIYEDSNNMYSLYLVSQLARGKPFILNNSDLSISDEIISLMVNCEDEDCVAMDAGRYNDESMKVSVNDEGYISNISKLIPELVY